MNYPNGFERAQRQYDAMEDGRGGDTEPEDVTHCPMHPGETDTPCAVCGYAPDDYKAAWISHDHRFGRSATEDERNAATPLVAALQFGSTSGLGVLATMTPAQANAALQVVSQQEQFGAVDGMVLDAALLVLVAREMVSARARVAELEANLAFLVNPEPKA